jgi:glutamate carboxypeptidase
VNSPHLPILDWIDSQADALAARLVEWASMNTGSANIAGIDRFGAILASELRSLGAAVEVIDLPPKKAVDSLGQSVTVPVGRAISAVKRPDAPMRVFLCIHTDTVYPTDHPFQTCTRIDANTLQGPGVADAKGGILVLLTALAALEKSPAAAQIGWEVLLNPDEEIGSMSSAPLLKAAASRNRIGLLFEPATADGALIDRRKGSGGFTIVVHGRSAHVGRDFANGRNAMVAAARLVLDLHDINGKLETVTVNVGKIEGGGPSNVVPDLAIVRVNVRTTGPADELRVAERLTDMIERTNRTDGIHCELHGAFHSSPKIPDARVQALMDLISRCGAELNLPIRFAPSGGACDGNKLLAYGLPNVDTLGPCGGNLHSPREFVLLDSLRQRAKLAALVLLQLASGEATV